MYDLEEMKSALESFRRGETDFIKPEYLDELIALLASEIEIADGDKRLPVCECCGKAIDHINTSHFNYDGTDSEVSHQIQYEPCSGCVSFTTDLNWTDYELTDEERKEGIRCPYCGKYPFDKNCEIDLYEPVEVLMWVTKPHELFPGDMEE